MQKKRPTHSCERVFEEGGDILSHQMAVPSALLGLTSLFGMGRGEPHCYNHLNCRSDQSRTGREGYYLIS